MCSQSIRDALKDEQMFLQRKYPLLVHKLGTPYLSKVLQGQLMQHIRACIPALKTRINVLTANFQKLLFSYGDEIEDKVPCFYSSTRSRLH